MPFLVKKGGVYTMGYRSEVTIELHGQEDDIQLVVDTYKLAMAQDKAFQVSGGASILDGLVPARSGDVGWGADHFFVIRKDAGWVVAVWHWESIKWYDTSDYLLEELLKVVDSLSEQIDVIAYFLRVGESPDDVEQKETKQKNPNQWTDAETYPYTSISLPNGGHETSLRTFFSKKDEVANV
jgi:hypothetical protein